MLAKAPRQRTGLGVVLYERGDHVSAGDADPVKVDLAVFLAGAVDFVKLLAGLSRVQPGAGNALGDRAVVTAVSNQAQDQDDPRAGVVADANSQLRIPVPAR